MYGEGWNRRNYIFVVLGIICFLAAAGLLHTFKGRFGQDTAGKMTVNMMPVMEDTIDVSSSEQQPSSQAVNGDAAAPGTEKGEWVVYITGAVKNPGVYRVPEGARKYQALEAAGGFTPGGQQGSRQPGGDAAGRTPYQIPRRWRESSAAGSGRPGSAKFRRSGDP